MIQIAGGTVTGSGHQHRLNVRNNQDAYTWLVGGDGNTACTVICDGCSSGKHSEVGANIIANKSIQHIMFRERELSMANSATDKAFDHTRWRIVHYINNVWLPIRDYYLCTILGVLVGLDHLTTFSIGDGVAYLNGNEIELPDYGNHPPYLAYELIQDQIKNPIPELYKFQIHAQIPVDEFETCLIGSDGVKDLAKIMDISEFWTDNRYFQNPDQVRRRLAKINERKIVDGREQLGPLGDDTTLVVIRRGDVDVLD